jgi:hypothetical protein
VLADDSPPNTMPFDSQISVYTGGCDSLKCIDGNDEGDVLGYSSAVVLSAEADTQYHVLVMGWGQSRGAFSVEVRDVVRPSNDVCDNTIILEPYDTVAGSTLFATQGPEHNFER